MSLRPPRLRSLSLPAWCLPLLVALFAGVGPVPGALNPGIAQAEGAVALSGQILGRRGSKPVPGAVIKLEELGVITLGDDLGRFTFPPQAPGAYTLQVVAQGYEIGRIPLTLKAGEPLELEVRLEPEAGTGSSGNVMVIEERQETTEPTVRKISAEEIQRVPGSFGDAVRVVQNLPGVARSPFGLGFLIVRGTEPDDTGTYVDGIRVPLIFHFGGLTAVINTDILEQVKFLPGGYGARYGRNLGGVVDVTTKELIPQEPSGYADIDLIDTTLFYSRPAGERGGLTFSVRRSYVDAVVRPVLPRILPEDSQASIQLPVYEDYQALYDTTLGDRHRFHVFLFGSRDRVSLQNGSPPASVDPLITEGGNAGVTIINHKLLARWTYLPTDTISNKVTLAFGPDTNKLGFGAFSVNATSYTFFYRDDFVYDVDSWLRVRAGLDGVVILGRFGIELPFSLDSTELDPLGEPDADSLQIRTLVASPSPYLEADFDAGPVIVTPGVRVDPYWIWDGDDRDLIYRAVSVDPRVAARWRLSPKAALKGSAGRFSNAPAPFAIYPDLGGNPDLDPEWAFQASFGGEYRFTENIAIDGSVYRGELRDLIVAGTSSEDPAAEERPIFVPSGAGVNQGLEVLLRHDPVDTGFFGWISYTLQKAERTDDLENACPRTGDDPGPAGCVPWYAFDFDQTHILTLVASQKLKRGWEVGFRFRYTTGTPYTPLETGFYDVDDDSYSAFSGERNSLRYPGFHQLDVRVDKRFDVRWGELSAALEVLNVYNRKNPEAVSYNFDYSQSQYVSGIPIFPAFGIKARF